MLRCKLRSLADVGVAKLLLLDMLLDMLLLDMLLDMLLHLLLLGFHRNIHQHTVFIYALPRDTHQIPLNKLSHRGIHQIMSNKIPHSAIHPITCNKLALKDR